MGSTLHRTFASTRRFGWLAEVKAKRTAARVQIHNPQRKWKEFELVLPAGGLGAIKHVSALWTGPLCVRQTTRVGKQKLHECLEHPMT